jgi:MFS family permease
MTSRPTIRSILSAPGAPALLGSSILARLPLAMFSIALLVHAQHLTGSFAIAGLVTGAYAVTSAVCAPPIGRLVDRRGQSTVLVWCAAASAVVLIVDGLLPAGTPAWVLIALGAATGACSPPLDACVRTLLPAIVADPAGLPALFTFESTLLEVTFVAGPPLALGVGAVWSTGAALIVSGVVMLVGTLAFAAQPVSRRRRLERGEPGVRGSSLRSGVIRALVVIELGTGIAFGATEVGVTAATHALASSAAAGPLLGLWGLGSLLGGAVATRLGGSTQSARGLTLLLIALAVAHGALILTTGSVLAMGIVITVAGATIAPTASTVCAMVDAAAPAGTHTEAYSWLLTAGLVGASAGSAAGGVLAQTAGPAVAFAVVAAGGGLAVLVALLRSGRLQAQAPLTGLVCLSPTHS